MAKLINVYFSLWFVNKYYKKSSSFQPIVNSEDCSDFLLTWESFLNLRETQTFLSVLEREDDETIINRDWY